MPKKKLPQTIEDCNAELERTQKQLQQYENRNKMRLYGKHRAGAENHDGGRRKGLSVSHRKEYGSTGVFEKTRRGGGSWIIPLVTRAHLYTLAGVVRSAESL